MRIVKLIFVFFAKLALFSGATCMTAVIGSESPDVLDFHLKDIEYNADQSRINIEVSCKANKPGIFFLDKQAISMFVKKDNVELYPVRDESFISTPYDKTSTYLLNKKSIVRLEKNQELILSLSLSMQLIGDENGHESIKVATLKADGIENGELLIKYYVSGKFWDREKNIVVQDACCWVGRIGPVVIANIRFNWLN